MASKGGVINAALHHIRESESQNPLTDNNTWVQRVRNRYDAKVQLLFEKHPWNFCSKVQALTASEPAPAGWAFGFNKPAKCWRIVRVTDSLANMDPQCLTIPYEDMGGRILSNCASTYLKFISGDWLTLEGSWPQVFADAVAAEIACAVGPVTEGDEGTIDRLKLEARTTLRDAKNWDAQQNPIWEPPPSRWQVARFQSPRGTRNWRNG